MGFHVAEAAGAIAVAFVCARGDFVPFCAVANAVFAAGFGVGNHLGVLLAVLGVAAGGRLELDRGVVLDVAVAAWFAVAGFVAAAEALHGEVVGTHAAAEGGAGGLAGGVHGFADGGAALEFGLGSGADGAFGGAVGLLRSGLEALGLRRGPHGVERGARELHRGFRGGGAVDALGDGVLNSAAGSSGGAQNSAAAVLVEQDSTNGASGEAGGDGFACGEATFLPALLSGGDVALTAGPPSAWGIHAKGGGGQGHGSDSQLLEVCGEASGVDGVAAFRPST